MPWQIVHKCKITNAEPDGFAIIRTEREGRKVTLAQCENHACQEQMALLGHDLFKEAIHTDQVQRDLPPGFWIPNSSRRT